MADSGTTTYGSPLAKVRIRMGPVGTNEADGEAAVGEAEPRF